jgi:hypothetical protein
MIAMFAIRPDRSAQQPKRKHRPRCGAKNPSRRKMLSEGRTRESPLQFPRWIVDGSENGGWSRPDCKSPAPVAGVFIEKDTGGTTLLRPL